MGSNLTPMMRQYRRVKEQIPHGALLLFRLGDFYEMVHDDARTAAPILDIALTRRNGVPMCGVPYHAADAYIARLVRAGHKVAVCDQVEEPSKSSGIVRRELTQIITAGTTTSESLLQPARNNYLMACLPGPRRFGLAFLDMSTGEFRAAELDALADVGSEIARWAPTEVLLPERAAAAGQLAPLPGQPHAAAPTLLDDEFFSAENGEFLLTENFGTGSLAGFGLSGMPAAIGACGAILAYLRDVLHRGTAHITSLGIYDAGRYVGLDGDTQRNLELIEDARTGRREGSLLGVIDESATPMGGRVLRAWVLRPLRDPAEIRARQSAVRWLADHPGPRASLRETLRAVRDLERTASRIGMGQGGPRDLAALADAVDAIPRVRGCLAAAAAEIVTLRRLLEQTPEMPDLARRIRESLVDEPPALARDGGVFRPGTNEELDVLRDAAGQGRTWVAAYQEAERQRTGIRSLKVRYNKVFGYYIEVTRANLDLVPPDYRPKQTLANAERYVTDDLKTYESRIVGAEERARELEIELFQELRQEVTQSLPAVQQAARALAEADALSTLAEIGTHRGYCMPEIDDGDTISIEEGRHPVIERSMAGERFVPNDTRLDGGAHQILVITGPNMAGKSTYIRQVALLVLMAQMGSMIPARRARIGVVDRIFTRVGASDDLAGGRSTFMVEMHETANILNNATSRSLVVLDEIGRGTSTFDGISIAWAVAEYLHENAGRRARTLFATHYHELTDLARSMSGVKNYSIAVRESRGRIIFLRKIVPAPADRSYGIHVARLAGLPPGVVARAEEILKTLEEGELTETGQPRLAQRRRRTVDVSGRQLSLFAPDRAETSSPPPDPGGTLSLPDDPPPGQDRPRPEKAGP